LVASTQQPSNVRIAAATAIQPPNRAFALTFG
jgi:hypothetical protein